MYSREKVDFNNFFFLLQDIFTKTWQKNTNLQYHGLSQENDNASRPPFSFLIVSVVPCSSSGWPSVSRLRPLGLQATI